MIELVEEQLLAQLRLLALADVLDDANAIQEAAGRVAHGRRAHVDPDDAPVLADHALLDDIPVTPALRLLDVVLVVPLPVIRVGHVEHDHPEELVAAVAGDGTYRLVDTQQAALLVDLGDADRSMRIGRGEPLLAFAPGILDPAGDGDVLHAVDRTDDAAVLVPQRLDTSKHADAAAVAPLDDQFHIADAGLRAQHLRDRPLVDRNRAAVGAVEPLRATEAASLVEVGGDPPQLDGTLVVA